MFAMYKYIIKIYKGTCSNLFTDKGIYDQKIKVNCLENVRQ